MNDDKPKQLIRTKTEIHDLEFAGCSILITHFRVGPNGLAPAADLRGKDIQARGGMTQVVLVIGPKRDDAGDDDGPPQVFHARSMCSRNDPFCRKEGVNRALKKIADHMAKAGVPEHCHPKLWRQMPELNFELPHNPDGLTDEQVGVSAGYRLLSVSEVKRHPAGVRALEVEIGCFNVISDSATLPLVWVPRAISKGDMAATYRTRLSKEQLAIQQAT